MMTLIKTLAICAVTLAFPISGWAGEIHTSINAADVPTRKSTALGQYLSVYDAYDLLVQDPHILFIDVRDPVEISQMGHPQQIDAIVPIKVQSEVFDEDLNEHVLVQYPEFLHKMRMLLDQKGKSRHDMIIVTCGSGVRSAEAADVLIKAGFTNVWHIVDGYVGDTKIGTNTHNAWQMAGLPWSHSDVTGSSWAKVIPVD